MKIHFLSEKPILNILMWKFIIDVAEHSCDMKANLSI